MSDVEEKPKETREEPENQDSRAPAEDLTTTEPAPDVPRVPKPRRIKAIAFLVFGLLVAAYLATQGPQEQHLNVVLGAAAPSVTGLSLQYVNAQSSAEIAREAVFSYAPGSAPRVVAHEPHLPNGDYRLQIDVDARDGRRSVQRQVTLGGGSTQIDISSAISAPNPSP